MRPSQAQSPSTSSSNNTITAIKFVDEHRVLSSGDHDGVVKMWDLRRSYSLFRGDPRPAQVFNHPMDSSNRGFVSMIVDSQKRRFYVSCMDSKVYEWDLHASDPRPIRSFVGSETRSFFARIALSPDDCFLVSGSSDSNAYVWDTSLGCRALVEPMAVLEGHAAEVTCASWSSKDWKLATCSDDMTQFLWKLNTDVEDSEKQTVVGKVALRSNEDKENEPKADQAGRKRKLSLHTENAPPVRRPLVSLE
jgi:denticleless